MSLALALKILMLAVLFVVSGGALFSDWGRRHMVLVGLASIVAILGTFYLIADIYEDLKRDSVETLREELLAERQRQRTPPQPAPEEQPEPSPEQDAVEAPEETATTGESRDDAPERDRETQAACDGVEVDLASGGTRCITPGSGESFKDCAQCPEMVVVPAGSFMMGSTQEEIAALTEAHGDYFKAEGPQHEVTIPQPFAVGEFEVTRGQFAQFVRETGHDAGNSCRTWDGERKEREGKTWRDPGFTQSDNDPVVCVSWNDAQAYVKWLSEKTGKSYRLPSAAEWEYAARAGTTGPFSFEGPIMTDKANYDGNFSYAGSPKGEYRQRTVPVDSFAPNPWGLHDVHGNVWEWVEDCWNASYADKPDSLKVSGAAWTAGNCDVRVLRGGSWYSTPQRLRSAVRGGNNRDNRFVNVGFRLARTLTP